MNLPRWLQLQTAFVALLGAAFLLFTGDRTPFPLALGMSAIVAFLVTDWLGWIKLPRGLGNLAALAAVVWTFREFLRLAGQREAQLLSISHMLIYLQVMLLFQHKSRRVHWQLLVLSILQVVVAAALSLGAQFGLLLVLYLAAAVACMLLLCYQREAIEAHAQPASSGKSPASLHRLLDPPRLQSSDARLRQLEDWVRLPWFAPSVFLFTMASIAFTLVFFVTAPRLSDAMWQATRGRTTTSGYSGQVELRSAGRIELSDQPVMRVSFSSASSGQAISLVTEPYFHGQVLTHYHSSPQDGTASWSHVPAYRMNRRTSRVHEVQEALPGDLVRQEVVLDAARSTVLFTMMPVKRLPETPGFVKEYRQSPRLARTSEEEILNPTREIRYTVGTVAIRNGRQLAAIPHFNPGETLDEIHQFDLELNHHRAFNADQYPRIKQAADDVIRARHLQNESKLVRAVALRDFLATSGQFHYALDSGEVNPATSSGQSLDPLENFIAHRRRGHCEYFASALVLMLRSQDIPARLVIGYKGGDWNAIGQYYLVRQKHAHAWVEVLLTTPEVPPEEIAGRPSASGAWFRLDPTPASAEQSEADDQAMGAQVADVFDYADYLWRDYVLGLNAGKQETVLEPLTSRSRALLPATTDVVAWQQWLRGDRATPRPAATDSRVPWFRFAALLAIVVAVPPLTAGLLLFGRSLWSQASRHQRTDRPTSSPLFTELKRALQRHGVESRPQATASELADLAAARLKLPAAKNGSAAPGELSAILQSVVRSYHRVRFGGGNLTAAEEAQFKLALDRLQQAEAVPSMLVN